MSTLATVILAWAAVHTYVGVFHAILHLRRRADREHLAFAVFSFGFAVYCFGEALLTDATSLAEGTRASRILISGAAVAAGALVDLCLLLVGRPESRLTAAAYGWAAFGLAANLAGLFHDPVRPMSMQPAPSYHEPELLPLGLLWATGACVLGGAAVLHVMRTVRVESDLHLLLVAVVIAVGAGAHDVVLHRLDSPYPYALGHASLVTSFLIGYLLLRRFVRAGDELTRRTEELRRSYEELRNIQQELVRKEELAAVGELSAVIAHEVRNPLAIMKNAVSGLRRSNLGAGDRSTLLDILDEESDRLNRLVHDLLAYARPAAPQGNPVEVAELVQEALDAATAGGPGGVQIAVNLDEGPSTVYCDRELLGRALVNLAENALQAMPAGGTLDITSSTEETAGRRMLCLRFEDTGEGMDTLVRNRARDPFFTTRPSGTGLGLAIVERVVRAHGGELKIDSRHGSGTRVEIRIPVGGPSDAPPRT